MSGYRYINFVYLFEEPALSFIELSYFIFLVSISFISALLFMISFLLLTREGKGSMVINT